MVRFRFGLALAAALAIALPARGDDSGDWFDKHEGELIELYRHFHSHPELSYKEVVTAARVADELKKAGVEVTTGVGGFGVVGVLRNGRGPTVLVRSDLDALPVTEATGLPFASKATAPTRPATRPVGVMHACGHDIHMTNLIATARWLAEHKTHWTGTLIFIGQPAEEKIGGAKEMLADGLYTRFPAQPDCAWPSTSRMTSRPARSPTRAARRWPRLRPRSISLVKGKVGTKARPTRPSTRSCSRALLSFSTSRRSSAERSTRSILAVVTVGSIHAGTKHNIIPNDVRLQLALRARAYRPEVGEQLIEGINRRAKGLAEAHKAPAPVVTIGESTPPTVNTPSLVAKVVPILLKELGMIERRQGRARDGCRGLRAFRARWRADLHVPARHDPARSSRLGQGEGRRDSAVAPLGVLLSRRSAEPPDRSPGDDLGRRRLAPTRIGEGRAMIDPRYPIHHPEGLLSPSLLIFVEVVRHAYPRRG